MTNNVPVGDILVYRAANGQAQVEVRVDRETVWLTQDQMGRLFGRERSVITKHIRNVFKEKELEAKSVCAKFAHTAEDGKTYQVDHFNLDVIISIGYRVNSKQGVQFRQWATGILRDHLVKGFTLNQKRLSQKALEEARQAIKLLSSTLKSNSLLTEQGQAVLDVVTRYAGAWRLLLDYDEGRLASAPRRSVPPLASFTVVEARQMAASLRQRLTVSGEAGALFGQERGKALEGILGALDQTFGGHPVYPSAQVRAAHLLYLVIKDHPFSDGNKRIASLLFLEYLRRTGLLLATDETPRLAGNAVVALALLVAESAPQQKDTMIHLILNLLEDE